MWIKHTFDFILALIGLLLLGWLIIILWVFASLDTLSNGLIQQPRVGKDGNIFKMFKLKSMRKVDGIDTVITTSKDPRITHFGKFLRKFNLDELPQLLNVLMGSMSFVGPRPDVPGYADQLTGENRKILELRPGITGPASLKYVNEEEILADVKDPEKYNDEVIYPDKVRINLDYYYNHTLWSDVKIILRTVF